MTLSKKESIAEMAYRLTPAEDILTVLKSLNTAWRRAQEGSDTKAAIELGTFKRERDDLTDIEQKFVSEWFAKRTNAEPGVALNVSHLPPSVAADNQEVPRLKQRINDLMTENKAQREQHANDLKAQSEAHSKGQQESEVRFQKRLSDEVRVKLAEQRATLMQSQTGDVLSKVDTARKESEAERRRLNDEVKALEAAKSQLEKAAIADKQTIETHRVSIARLVSEKDGLLLQHQTAIKTWATEKDAIIAGYLTTIEELTTQLETANKQLLKLAWKMKLPSILDLISYSEIVAALAGSFVFLQWVGLTLFMAPALFYFNAIRTVKKVESWHSASFAVGICLVLSVAFGFVHYNTVMKLNTSTVFTGPWFSFALALLLSGTSVASMYQQSLEKDENA